eukprot:457565-Prorocentrum_minimum.AAC.2
MYKKSDLTHTYSCARGVERSVEIQRKFTSTICGCRQVRGAGQLPAGRGPRAALPGSHLVLSVVPRRFPATAPGSRVFGP